MKSTLVNSMPTGDWIYEIKFDGYHALALRGGNQTRILSRSQKDLGKKSQIITVMIVSIFVQVVGTKMALTANLGITYFAIYFRI